MMDTRLSSARRDVEVIVCIGLEKTGTTTLQQLCASRRRFLLEHRILYPHHFAAHGGSNHIFLAAYAQDDDKIDNVRGEIFRNKGLDLPALRRRVRSEADFIAKRSDYDRVIVSNEHLHSRITNTRELLRLRGLLETIGTRIRVCVIVRRQDRLATSILSTMMKGGRTNIHPVLPDTTDLPLYYRYYDLLDMYEEVFGPGSVHVGVYEDQAAEGISLFDIFEDITELGIRIPRPKKGLRRNPALNKDGLLLLGKINERAADDQQLSQLQREKLILRLETGYSGHPVLISRAEAANLLNACNEQNENVRKRWLPERRQLFDADTSMLPTEVVQPNLSPGEILRLATDLLAWVRSEDAAPELDDAI